MSARSPQWFENALGPRLNLKELNVICWCLFFFFFVPSVYDAVQMQSRSGSSMEYGGFVNFYAMGRILNEYPPADLYDLNLQNRICNEIHPPKPGGYGPIPYPPFVGIPLKFLARMPYTTAYTIWLLSSLVLYLAALTMVGMRVFPRDPLRHSLTFCLGLSFFPFAIETLFNGQLSTVGFFLLALAFLLEDSGRDFWSGLALSLCAYKPTLLILIIPMLFLTRRFKVLYGMIVGGLALLLLTTIFIGTSVWHGYLGFIFHFGETSIGVNAHSNLHTAQYVDLVNFSSLVPSGRAWWMLTLLVGFGLWAILSLMRAWRRASEGGKSVTRLCWAATITWTLLLNAYVPIYDTTLVFLSVLITAGVLNNTERVQLRSALNLIWVAIFVSSWFAIHLAESWHFQIMTLLLAALGAFQLVVSGRVPRPPEATMDELRHATKPRMHK